MTYRTRRCLLAASVLLLASAPLTGQDPFAALDRARFLLQDPAGPTGGLAVECAVRMEEAGDRRTALPIDVVLDLGGVEPLPERLRVTLVAATIEGELATFQETVPASELEGKQAWLYRGRLELADEVHGAVAVVEILGGERWGGCAAELADAPLAPPAGLDVAVHDPGTGGEPQAPAPPAAAEEGRGGPEGTGEAPESQAEARARALEKAFDADPGGQPGGRGTAGGTDGGVDARVIVILPPDERPARGRTRFKTMVATPLVESVAFFLDGEEAARDDRGPFSATLDLGPEAVPHTVRAVAYDRSGIPLGEHRITLNERSAPFDVAITRVRPVLSHRPGGIGGGDGGGFLHVEAEVSVPPGASLERLEVYRNEELVETLREAPFEARLPLAGEPGPADYVRVVARLADGRSLEDVRLLAAGTPSERVEVNLVELFAVVTSPDGAPVEGLSAEDFRIVFDGERRQVERFQVADDVPLVLGLLVDNSESMAPLVFDTRMAAGRFLGSTLIEGDRAFLVTFDNRPRLLQPATGDLQTLTRALGLLSPRGRTALYDSIVFSLAQMQETSGRRALVLITDGRDFGSRFSTRRAIHDAKRLAVPVYVISIAGLYEERGTVRRADLEAIVGHTGGRIFYIADPSELGAAYARINRELRSQYILAFGTARFLSEEELDDIELEVERPGLEVRWTAGATE